MIFTNIAVDEQGHSYFRDVEIEMTGSPQRIASKPQDVLYWELSSSIPGHFMDFAPSAETKFLAVLSGQMDVIVSNGETRYFARGDMLIASDLTGQGHIKRFVGIEPCNLLTIALANTPYKTVS